MSVKTVLAGTACGHGVGLHQPYPRPNVICSTWTLRLQDWMTDTGMSLAKKK
jgi:hypothetical protein